ncbi:TetR/AcrR family transcriptional regulator [Morganella morganii]|uniref:TetR/AcrR family transcriptional regulator n=1 Tax=Morganella morganii TaxID=582 RepID=UPI001BD5AB44|nr:TetR/AcrR family transcriptional regulator [Morganella morganii subsp. morganii]QWL85289.1 TetR/AcrR family transcriptional regulator [Morganella morganii subsp. morganii]
MNTLTRQQENSARTRQALLISAHGLFIEKGYQSVSIDEIARDARVTKGAFYHHFKSKSDLLLHCYEIQLQKISAVLDNIEPLADKLGRAAACCPQFHELSGTALPGTDSGSGSDAGRRVV